MGALDGTLADFERLAEDMRRMDGKRVRAGIVDDPENARKLAYNELGVGSFPAVDGTPQLRKTVVARTPLTGAFDAKRGRIEADVRRRIAEGEDAERVLQDAGDSIVADARSIIDGGYTPGPESLECRLFTELEIPWERLAFPVMKETLQRYYSDRSRGNGFPLHRGEIIKHPTRPA